MLLGNVPKLVACGLLDRQAPPLRSARRVPPPLMMHATMPADADRPRTILIGDVHGCLEELEELLDACAYDAATSRVVLVGDLVNKGPSSAGVVSFARRNRFWGVRGNHDEEAVAAWTRRTAERADGGACSPHDKYAYTDTLSSDDVAFLRELPYTLYVAGEGVLVVHAGLVPGVPLAEQEPRAMCYMRDVWRPADGADDGSDRGRYQWSNKITPGKTTAWAAEWRPDPVYGVAARHVVFGHDARRGLQQHAHATGLDTGCCYGKRLTALVLPEWRLVSVEARAVHSKPKDG